MASSPVSASTWNSCETEPPMLPVSASTGRVAEAAALEDAAVGASMAR
jgi:hypothetical protein